MIPGCCEAFCVVDAELLLQHAVVPARLLLLAELHAVLALLLAATAVLARRVRAALDAALVGEAALALEEQLLALAAALLALGRGVAGHQTRLRLRGRQPLWACGVTSRTPVTSRPAAWSERIAVSRPEPGPLTKTSTFCRPCSMPLRAAESAVTCAANGVDLREPLKPAPPADSHAMTLPSTVGERDDRVVERRLDVGLAHGDVLLRLAAAALRAARSGTHLLLALPSSSRRPACASGPCGCARWSSCSGRAPEGHGDGAGRGSSRSPSGA